MAIRSAIGIDATALFESYHNLTEGSKHVKMLQPLYVGDIIDYRPVAVFDSEFAKDVIQAAKGVVGDRPRRERASNYILVALSLSAYLAALTWLVLAPSLLPAAACGLTATHLILLAHLGSHFSLSRHDWFNRIGAHLAIASVFTFAGPEHWDMIHVTSHHSYINSTRDFERAGLNSFKSYSIPTAIRAYHYLLSFINHPGSVVTTRFNILGYNTEGGFSSIVTVPLIVLFIAVFNFAMFFLKLGLPLWLYPGCVLSFPLDGSEIDENSDGIGPDKFYWRRESSRLYREGIINAIPNSLFLYIFCAVNRDLPWYMVVYYFGIQNFVMNGSYNAMQNPTHTSAAIEPHVQPTIAPTTDWYKHSATNSHSSTIADFLPEWVCRSHFLVFLFGCGFGFNHIAHHLFPCLAVEYLQDVETALLPVFAKHNVPFHASTSALKLYDYLRSQQPNHKPKIE